MAPVSNYEDSQALVKAFDPTNCPFHNYYATYHVGLDLYSYDNELVKVFPNGILWNNTIHEPLYLDYTKPYYDQWKNYSKCPEAFLDIAVGSDKKSLGILPGNTICNRKRRYVCLKPASNCASASALVNESNAASYQVNVVAFGALVGCSLFVIFGLIMYHFKSLKKRSMTMTNDEKNLAADGCSVV